MSEKYCLNVLFDPSKTIVEKTNCIIKYIQCFEIKGNQNNIDEEISRQFALKRLFDEIPEKDYESKKRLEKIFDEIAHHLNGLMGKRLPC
jgi:hypothetical protein